MRSHHFAGRMNLLLVAGRVRQSQQAPCHADRCAPEPVDCGGWTHPDIPDYRSEGRCIPHIHIPTGSKPTRF
jgi:hypothetical protein